MTKLPFTDFLPPLLTRMVEDQFVYGHRGEEELARWPIFESLEAQSPVLAEQARQMSTSRSMARPLRFRRLLSRFGQS
jgi:hypothetical protein